MKSKKKKKTYATLLRTYRDPTTPGSLGGVARFARAQPQPVETPKPASWNDSIAP